MEKLVLESIMDANNIMTEINSEYMYESIMLESESTGKSTFVEKVKKAWELFVKFFKNMATNAKNLIIKAAKGIKDGAPVNVKDFDKIMQILRDTERDMKSGNIDTSFNDIRDTSLYKSISTSTTENKLKVMKRIDAVKYFEKLLHDLQGIIDSVTKITNDAVTKFDNSTAEEQQKLIAKLKATNVIKQFLEGFVSEIMKQLQVALNTTLK